MIPQFKVAQPHLCWQPTRVFGPKAVEKKGRSTELKVAFPKGRHSLVLSSSLDAISSSEEDANQKRREEAGGRAEDQDQW